MLARCENTPAASTGSIILLLLLERQFSNFWWDEVKSEESKIYERPFCQFLELMLLQMCVLSFDVLAPRLPCFIFPLTKSPRMPCVGQVVHEVYAYLIDHVSTYKPCLTNVCVNKVLPARKREKGDELVKELVCHFL